MATSAAADHVSFTFTVAEYGGNVFEELINTVEVCSLGQITEALHEAVGHYRPTV